jgi:hypothetical protein
MSMMLSERKAVKGRRDYHCDLCGEMIPKGEPHDTRTGVQQGDGFWTMRMHPECQQYEQSPAIRAHLMDWYEDISEPAFPRADAIAYCSTTNGK